MLEEGWYLMSPAEVERVLLHPDRPPADGPRKIPIDDALAYRGAGNVPDDDGRWLRLVLRVVDHTPEAVTKRRLEFEPDFLDAPAWRRPGSKPVNVIPLIEKKRTGPEAWWDDAAIAELESEWQEHGTMSGVKVPAEYRSFVHKTVAALNASGRDVTPESIADSIARWTEPADAARIRRALLDANET